MLPDTYDRDLGPSSPLKLPVLLISHSMNTCKSQYWSKAVCSCHHCSLNHNQLTSTSAVALASALQQNKSLKDMK